MGPGSAAHRHGVLETRVNVLMERCTASGTRCSAPQRFFLLAKFTMEEEHRPLPTQSRAELHMRRRQWDKTSEVPAVHGASHWWALSKAVKPHFLKRYWRARARSRAPA